MTPPRPPARLLVRLLAVAGGAFVVLILGAAAAGAAESHPAESPTGPISVAVPSPAVPGPLHPPAAGIEVHVPGVTATTTGADVAVTADPVGFVPTPPDLPRPLPSPTLPLPPAVPVPVPRPADPATAARAVGTHAPLRAAADRDGVEARHTIATTPMQPQPTGPTPATPDPPFTIALVGLALGLQLSTRHDGLDDHLVTTGSVGAMRRLVPVGRAALERALAPRPGFALLPTRPG